MTVLELTRRSAVFILVAAGLWIAPGDVLAADSKPVVELWPDGAPGSEGKDGKDNPETVRVTDAGDHVVSNVHRPSLSVYVPTGKATGAGVLVIPGGSHRELWMDHEGHAVARWLSEHGIAAFVLKYRLARQEGSTYSVTGHALPDAQRALRTIRARAKEWQVAPARLGVLGFSAGGELAGLTAQARAGADAKAGDAKAGPGPEGKAAAPVDRESSRAAFQVLVYPGRSESIAPSAKSPPAFLLCGENDRPDISQGLAKVYLRFKEAGVSAELHVLAGAGHGFGARASNRGATARWLELVHGWLEGSGFLSATAPAPSKP